MAPLYAQRVPTSSCDAVFEALWSELVGRIPEAAVTVHECDWDLHSSARLDVEWASAAFCRGRLERDVFRCCAEHGRWNSRIAKYMIGSKTTQVARSPMRAIRDADGRRRMAS